MDEEKKTYSVIGTVTIGTDEYRDLLTEKFEAQKEKEQEHDRWYSCYCEKRDLQTQYDKLKTQCEKLKEELDRCKAYIKKTSVNEDVVSIFMSLFGDEE